MGQGSDVVSMQSSLIRLTTHKLDFVRLSVLTIPAFLSFPVVIPKALEDLNIKVFQRLRYHQSNAWCMVVSRNYCLPGTDPAWGLVLYAGKA